ncbi:MAG TPA: acylneuraminate cytidylyltransferase, partial [Candidatus Sumerlaeota bacterium]|nr:acylneuraminate cytidylyltransferase [Candidatus Sumerlaeota bacterium]
MRKYNAAVIMQARVGSTRLPGKILREIQGKTVLELDIERCLNIPNADGVVIATTPEPDAHQIVAVTRKFPTDKVTHFVGPVEDVLARYHGAALSVHASIIIRITSDCP